jgi:hypothetical protein
MRQNFKDLTYIVGTEEIVKQMTTVPVLTPFSEQVISFLSALSNELLKSGKDFSDVMTFAFWCRKAAVLQEKAKYESKELRLGRGVIFHSTPSNVPVNFAFSFVAGLLAGNANIVRLPAKNFAQVSIICNAINYVFNEMPKMRSYIVMVKYSSAKEISDYFSSFCSCRIIWGSDKTIAEMRKSFLPVRAKELVFADRYSILVINADAFLLSENQEKVVQDFYNDTYFSDQNACTSPHLIVWIGKEKSIAKGIFWSSVQKIVEAKYNLSPSQSTGKLAAFYRLAAKKDVRLILTKNNFVTRIAIKNLDVDLMDFKYHSGFFLEYDADNLSEIVPICSNKCQTMAYYGIDKKEIADFISLYTPKGIDRVVPVGRTMDFTLVWDGYDLIRELSRIVNL